MKRKRPIHENLMHQLKLAEEYLGKLYQLGCTGEPVIRAEREVEKLRRLTG